jgi:NTE family protein
MVANETTKKFNDCDILIRPANMNKYSMFSLKNLDIILDLGYNATINALKNNPLSSELLTSAELEAMNGFSIDTSVIDIAT